MAVSAMRLKHKRKPGYMPDEVANQVGRCEVVTGYSIILS